MACELGQLDRWFRWAPGPGAYQREAVAGLVPWLGHEREDAVTEGDQEVVSFAHAEIERGGGVRLDRVAVGVGDGQAMSAEGEGEDRVRGGVDHAEPDTVAGAALVGYGRCRYCSIDQVERIGDVASVAEERLVAGGQLNGLGAGGRGAAGVQAPEHVLRGLTVDDQPVIQDYGPFGVVTARLYGIINDQWPVEAAVSWTPTCEWKK